MKDIKDNPYKHISIIKISEDGKSYSCIYGEPSITSEYLTHFLLHSYLVDKKPDFKVVLHVHPTKLIAVSHLKKFEEKLFAIHPEIKIIIFEGIGVVEEEPGSMKLAEKTLEKIKKYRVIVWKRHGVVCVEKNLDTAVDLVEVLEKGAEIYLWIYKK